jgi:hypothetical protein
LFGGFFLPLIELATYLSAAYYVIVPKHGYWPDAPILYFNDMNSLQLARLVSRIALLLLVLPTWAHADRLLSDTIPCHCDTIFTTDGQMHFVQITDEREAAYAFMMCGDPDQRKHLLDRSMIQRVGKCRTPDIKPPAGAIAEFDFYDPMVRKARMYSTMGVLSLLLMFTVLFSVVGLILAIVAIIGGERLLRQAKGHPYEAYIRKKARRAIIFGMLSILLPFLVIFIALL